MKAQAYGFTGIETIDGIMLIGQQHAYCIHVIIILSK